MKHCIAYKRTLVTAPAAEPVSTADAKTWLYVTGSDHDTMIDSLVKTARRYIESEKEVALINQTWDISLDEFPSSGDPIYFQMYPIGSITSISYLDADGASQTWDAANYSLVQHDRLPGYVLPAANASYPQTQDIENAVTIRVVAGYGAASTDLPEEVITSVKMLTKLYYDNPEDMAIRGKPWERTAKILLNNLFPEWL